jgi:hypothetical protein
VPVYGRRIGVIPDAYQHVLAAAMHKATGTRPSLKHVSNTLADLRMCMWKHALTRIHAAHAARTWVYRNDPNQRFTRAENDKEALRRFERDRQKSMGASRRSRKRKRVKDFPRWARSVEPRVQARAEHIAGTHDPRPVRLSTRRASHRHLDPNFSWNLRDEYVLDMDELPPGPRRSARRCLLRVITKIA